MSLEIIRSTATEDKSYPLNAREKFQYEAAVEDGRITLDDLAWLLLDDLRRVEDKDDEQTNEDRTIQIEVLHHTSNGSPANAIATI